MKEDDFFKMADKFEDAEFCAKLALVRLMNLSMTVVKRLGR